MTTCNMAKSLQEHNKAGCPPGTMYDTDSDVRSCKSVV